MIRKKILFSTEVPVSLLELIEPLVDIHFVIASELRDNPNYLAYYKLLRDRTDIPIFLDNGMYEHGEPLKPEELLYWAKEINPTLVWAPDQVPDRLVTLEMSEAFYYASKPHPWVVGFIPQGDTPEEVVNCYADMIKIDSFAPMGISFLNDRPKVVEEIQKRYRTQWLKQRHHHFLGLYGTWEIEHWPVWVNSMDTVKPIKAGYYHNAVEHIARGRGKWDTKWNFSTSQRLLAYRNIAYMHTILTRRIKHADYYGLEG